MVGHNFNWTQPELLLVCDLLYHRGWRTLRVEDPEVQDLSDLLQKEWIHPLAGRPDKFRSPGSVRAKAENLRTSAPDYPGDGTRGGPLDRAAVEAFLASPLEMHARVMIIKNQVRAGTYTPTTDVGESASEGLNQELRVRQQAMDWLRDLEVSGEPIITRARAFDFVCDGESIPLMDWVKGIWRPGKMRAALSIKTTKPNSRRDRPLKYEDTVGSDGLLRYKYANGGRDHPDNVGLRRAFELKLPLIWFQAIAEGRYLPHYPVWIRADEPEHDQVVLAIDRTQLAMPTGKASTPAERKYADRVTRQRLHQDRFRADLRVAYENTCAICGLTRGELLEAAHIVPDSDPVGDPVVTNGLILCKLHHAAFDENLFGIRSDSTIEVRPDVLGDDDESPLLKHGLKEIHNQRLRTPTNHSQRPDGWRLDIRYHEFCSTIDER